MVRISWFFIRIIQERDEKKQKKTAGFPRVNQKSPAQAMQDSVGNASILPYICINQAWFPRKMAGIDDVYIIYSSQIIATSHELGPPKVAEERKWNKPTILILSKATPAKKPRGHPSPNRARYPWLPKPPSPGAGASNPPSFDVSMTAGICPSRLQRCEGVFGYVPMHVWFFFPDYTLRMIYINLLPLLNCQKL